MKSKVNLAKGSITANLEGALGALNEDWKNNLLEKKLS